MVSMLRNRNPTHVSAASRGTASVRAHGSHSSFQEDSFSLLRDFNDHPIPIWNAPSSLRHRLKIIQSSYPSWLHRGRAVPRSIRRFHGTAHRSGYGSRILWCWGGSWVNPRYAGIPTFRIKVFIYSSLVVYAVKGFRHYTMQALESVSQPTTSCYMKRQDHSVTVFSFR